jgi:hypothetical protein
LIRLFLSTKYIKNIFPFEVFEALMSRFYAFIVSTEDVLNNNINNKKTNGYAIFLPFNCVFSYLAIINIVWGLKAYFLEYSLKLSDFSKNIIFRLGCC